MKVVAIINRTATADRVLATVGILSSLLGEVGVSVLHPRYERDPSYLPTEEMPTPGRFERYRSQQRLCSARLEGRFRSWRSGLAIDAPVRWTELVGDPARTVPAEVDDADLVVLAMDGEDLHGDIARTFRGLRRSRRRFAVLVPQPGMPTGSVGSVAIGWERDRSGEHLAARVLPLLGGDAKITLCVGRGRAPAPASAFERIVPDRSLICDVAAARSGAGPPGQDVHERMRSYGADALAILSGGLRGAGDAEGGPPAGEQTGAIHAFVYRPSPTMPNWRLLVRWLFAGGRVGAVEC